MTWKFGTGEMTYIPKCLQTFGDSLSGPVIVEHPDHEVLELSGPAKADACRQREENGDVPATQSDVLSGFLRGGG